MNERVIKLVRPFRIIEIYFFLIILVVSSIIFVAYSGLNHISGFGAFISGGYFQTENTQEYRYKIDKNISLIQGNSLLPMASLFVPPDGHRIKEVYLLDISGYSSTIEETDNSPFITASGKHVEWGIVATNFPKRAEALPFGAKIYIPELFGEQIFIIQDRMNKRFNDRIDIWFPAKKQAIKFGIHRNIAVAILTPKLDK